MKLFITGMPGVGKSTIVQNVVSLIRERGYRVGGVSCPEIREGENRVGFDIIDLLSGRRGVLSHVRLSSGPYVGKYHVNLSDLSEVGVTALNNAVSESDIVVIDEVGPMELQGKDFQEAVIRAMESQKPVLGIVHWRIKYPLIERIKGRSDVKIYEVTPQNRDETQAKILEQALKALEK